MTEAEMTMIVEDVLFGYASAKTERAKKESRQFVHYTRVENVLSLLAKNEIWLRNSMVMNDYSEIAHGEECLRYVLFGNGETTKRSIKVLGEISPGLHERAQAHFEQTMPMRRYYTYILSISEHGPDQVGPGLIEHDSEFELGRLSMWRAYGSGGGVALVLNQKPFLTPSDYLNAFTSPVFYGGPQAFAHEWEKMLSKAEEKLDALRALPVGLFEQNFLMSIRFAAITCKHPGFAEEREWRVTYSADPANEHIDDEAFNGTSPIKREFRSISGVPQRIYKIPFTDNVQKGFAGATIPDLLEKLIIGPSAYPQVAYDAIYVALTRAGVPDAERRIRTSGIPIRQ